VTALLEKMRRNREWWHPVGGGQLLLRRPTLLQMAQWSSTGGEGLQLLRRCVVGWRGFRESDLVDGGSSDEVAFDVDAALEWLEDRPAGVAGISDAIHARVSAHLAEAEAAEKN